MKFETSAGGVVYRKVNNRPEFLIVQHSGHHRWVLPKGWIDEGETKEQAALREVKEEGGVEAEIEEYLGEITIFYTNPNPPNSPAGEGGEKVKKTSHFFLMKYVSGDPVKDHGWEVEDTMWLTPEKAIEKLNYPGEKKMIEKALELLPKS